MADKRRQTLRTQLGPHLHERIVKDLRAVLVEHRDEFAFSYLDDVLLSKYIGPETDSADLRRSRAIEKWLKTELRNARTNVRLYGGETSFNMGSRVHSEDVLDFARRVIARVLGPEPRLDQLVGSFSGGASTRVRREIGATARKFMGQAHVTAEALPWILPIILQCQGWVSNNPQVLEPVVVGGNVMFTVEKTTVIDRVACKEPELNMFAQKAIGDLIRRKLKRYGIDLNDQSINRSLAREGSKSGHLATIDLSSASDSVTTGLVARLLPPGWFVLLDAVRSKRTLIGDEWHENQMFSSMGNGFTFELETLVFFALARAVAYYSHVRGRISVYGDDIIVPVSMVSQLIAVFGFCGFMVNVTKSHYRGHFRESCGGHYLRGGDVTPFYIKEPIDTLERLIHFLNRLRKWAGQCFGDICDPRVYPVWRKWSRHVDRRLWGGSNVSDPTRLVSRHSPRFKLVRVTKSPKRLIRELQVGLYLTALNAIDGRLLPPTDGEESELLDELPVWVLRRVECETVTSFPLWHTPEGGLL